MMTGRTRAPPPEQAPPPAPEKAAPKPEEIDPEQDWQTAWKEFDPTTKGSITASQFRQVMEELGEAVTDVEVDDIINSVDGEDKISCKSNLRSLLNLRTDDPVFLQTKNLLSFSREDK